MWALRELKHPTRLSLRGRDALYPISIEMEKDHEAEDIQNFFKIGQDSWKRKKKSFPMILFLSFRTRISLQEARKYNFNIVQ